MSYSEVDGHGHFYGKIGSLSDPGPIFERAGVDLDYVQQVKAAEVQERAARLRADRRREIIVAIIASTPSMSVKRAAAKADEILALGMVRQ